MANLTTTDIKNSYTVTCLTFALFAAPRGALFLMLLLLIYSQGIYFNTTVKIPTTHIKALTPETKSPPDSDASRQLKAQRIESRYHGNGSDCKEDAKDLVKMGNRILSWEEMEKYTPKNYMNLKPPPYLSNFRTPCWLQHTQKYTVDGVAIACYPGVYVVGIPKSGTTDLYRHLINHREIVSAKKGHHYWSRLVHGSNKYPNLYSYSQRLLGDNDMSACSLSAHGPFHEQLVLDNSPSTLWDSNRWREFQNETETEPTLLVPHVVRHMTPDVKAVVILRDPVERLFSGYLFFNSEKKKSAGAFHEEVRRAVLSFQNCTEYFSLRSCAYYKVRSGPDAMVRIHVGLYSIYIQDWIEIFGRQRLHPVRLEDYSQNKTRELRRIFQFLGLETTTIDIGENARANRGKLSDAVSMRDDTRLLLREFYAPYNRRLADLMGEEKYLWGMLDHAMNLLSSYLGVRFTKQKPADF